MACRVFGLLLPKVQGGEARRAAARAGKRVFYESIFLQTKEF